MIKKMLWCAFIAISVASCGLNDGGGNNCPSIIGVSTTAVTGPVETQVNVPVVLEVSYTSKANCGGFVSFFQPPSVTPLVDIITVNAEYDSCSCDEVESTQKVNYTFKKSLAGTYLLKFKKTNDTFVEHSVVVQ